MQKRIKIVGFMLALFIVFQPMFPFLEYALFKNYISKNLCVEKDVVDSCCKGQCHLEKRISETAPTPENSANPTKEVKIQKTIEFEIPNKFICLKQPVIKEIATNSALLFYHADFYKSCFHPPQFV